MDDSGSVTKAECEELITSGYGIKACNDENDYWAGAVKQCGGTKNMPTLAQLAQLADQIYGESGIGEKEYKGGLTIKDQELWNTLISKSTNSLSFFYVWSGEESSMYNAHNRYFKTSESGYSTSNLYRDTSNKLAVCLSEAPKPAGLCDSIKDRFNISDYDCTLANVNDSSDFDKPHITFSNGLRLFVGSDFEELFPDAESENDRTGYKVYIDINGSKGKGILWEDVFPYYILKSGKVLAGYPTDAEIGGNNSEYLSVNVLYDDYSGANRAVKFLILNTDFKTAVCKTGIMKSNEYCKGVTIDDICKVYENDCRIKVKTPIKIF